MQRDTVRQLIAAIQNVDRTVQAEDRHIPLLLDKLVPVEKYSRARLFHHMSRQEPALFHSCRVPLRAEGETRALLLQYLRNSVLTDATASVRVGPSRARRRLRVREIADRWGRGRAVLGITDLHIRETEMGGLIDTRALRDFNVLLCGSSEMQVQEMLTLVISTKDYFTDSHSDDPDGNNHCFVGTKLWLMWETFEGLSRGLEDAERVKVCGQCRFDLDAFLDLKSSRWLTISEGQTLFLPGNLTHKVYTLEHYLGVGAFYVGLPNCIQTLARWIEHGPLWSLGDRNGQHGNLLDEITDAVIAKVHETRHSTVRVRRKWGLPELEHAIQAWNRHKRREANGQLLRDPRFARLLHSLTSAPYRSHPGAIPPE